MYFYYKRMIKKLHPLFIVFLGSILYYSFISIRYVGLWFHTEHDTDRFPVMFFHCLSLLMIISLCIFFIIYFIKYYSLDEFFLLSSEDKRICMISLGLILASNFVFYNIVNFKSTISNFHVFVLVLRNLKLFFTPFLPSFNFCILTLIGAPIIEEILFRGILQKYLIHIMNTKNPIIPITLASIAFTIILHWELHLTKITVIFLGGFVFGYIYYKTQKIIIPIIAHTFWNFLIVLFTMDLQTMNRGNSLVFFIFMVVFVILANRLYRFSKQIPDE